MKLFIPVIIFVALGFLSLFIFIGLSAVYGFKCKDYSAFNPVCLMTRGFGSINDPSSVSNAPLTREVTLNFWGLHIPEKVMSPIIAEYTKTNPLVKIQYDEKIYDGKDMELYKNTLKNRLFSNQAPHIFTINSNWLPEIATKVSTANASISLADYTRKYIPLASNTLVNTRTNSIAAIPYIYDGMALFYNKDILAIENLNPPKTWDEARDVGLKTNLYDKNSKATVRYGFAVGNKDNVDNFSDIIGYMLTQGDIRVPNDVGSNDALTIYKRFIDYQNRDKLWGLDMPNSINAFALNKVTLVFGKVSDIERILNINPNLNFGIVELPQLPTLSGNRTNVGWGSLWANSVSNKYPADEQKAAWDFLVWLNEEPQLAKLQENTLKFKKVGNIYANSEYAKKETSTYLKPFIIQYDQANTSYFTDNSGNDVYVNALKDIFNSNNVNSRNIKTLVTKLQSTYQGLLPKVE